MTDVDEMEISLLEGSEDGPDAHSSQGLLQAPTFLTGGISCDGNPKMTSSGSPSAHPSKRKAKTPSSRLPERSSENTVGAKSRGHPSAELPVKLPMPKIDLRALFDYNFRQKQRRSHQKKTPPEQKEATTSKTPGRTSSEQKEATTSKTPGRTSSEQKEATTSKTPGRTSSEQKEATTSKTPGRCTNIRRFRISAEEQNRRRRERRRRCRVKGRWFPFVEKFHGRKQVPLKMEYLYEQAALQGFFKYIGQLKYEHQLKKSLTQMNAGDDLENECLELRKHKYLDDDGPLSPIEETEDDQNENSDDIGAKIVENSCFILSSSIPEKKSKRKAKTLKVPRKGLQSWLMEGFFLNWKCDYHRWKQRLFSEGNFSVFSLQRQEFRILSPKQIGGKCSTSEMTGFQLWKNRCKLRPGLRSSPATVAEKDLQQ